MKLTRRSLLAGSAALPLAGLMPRFAVAEMALGSASFTTVSDGNLVLPGDFIFETMPQDELMRLLEQFPTVTREQVEPPCNLTLYRDGTNTVLFDAGSGSDFVPTAGQIVDSLEAAGVAPEDVTHVVITHGHPDHIWGLLDDFDEPLFYEAQHMMGQAEWDYWWDPATVEGLPEDRKSFAVGAKRRMEAIEDSVVLFGDGEEIVPGVMSLLTPGHTPGHMSFELRNGSDSVLVLGDAISNHHVALARPEWPSGSDQDRDMAAATRLKLLDRITSEQLRIAGFHFPEGGIGHIEAADDGFRFVAEGS